MKIISVLSLEETADVLIFVNFLTSSDGDCRLLFD